MISQSQAWLKLLRLTTILHVLLEIKPELQNGQA
jgi:hypothetical protein